MKKLFIMIMILYEIKSQYDKYDKLIMSPPPLENESTVSYPQINYQANDNSNYKFMQQNEYVLVPTPVEENYYNQMKQNGNSIIVNNPSFLNKNEVILPNIDVASSFNNTLNIQNHNIDDNKIEKYVNLQEQDYKNYFDAINKLEYQKVYNSLNPNDESKIYEQMLNTNIDFTNVINKTNLNIINLPEEKKQIEEVYTNLFDEINRNNTINLAGNQINNFNKTIKENYPRFLSQDIKQDTKPIALLENIIPEDQRLKIINIAKDRSKKKKEKVRLNLINCKKSCENACDKKLKDENQEMCVLRCHLACTNNALNQFIN